MKHVLLRVSLALVLAGTLGFPAATAQEEGAGSDWKSLKAEAKRQKIDEMARETLDALFAKSDKAKTLYEQAHGWAVFDNLKLAFGFSGGGGNGVAVDKQTGQRTYMKMGTAGIGLGLGGKKYQVVFLFQDAGTFDRFVDEGWRADASGSAAAGTAGAGAQVGFINGIAVYQLTESGLMAAADVSGTKYWKNKKLE